jgi:hypothetical protein
MNNRKSEVFVDRHDKIKHEIEQTLQRFENAERLPPNPFLWARLRARIANSEQRTFAQQTWRVLRPALAILFIAANIFTSVAFLSHSTPTDRSDYLSAFAEEFGLESDINDPFTQNQ